MVSWPALRQIITFRDALGFGFELSQDHPRGQFAVVTGTGHRVLQLTARLPQRPGVDVVVEATGTEAATLWPGLEANGGGLLIISVDVGAEPSFDPRDGRAYLRCRAGLARCRLTLRDWIRTDGDLYRSAAYSFHPATAWLSDPPAQRQSEEAPSRTHGFGP